MERRIYGLENEYGITCTLRGQRRLSPDEVARYLFRRVVSWGRSSNVFLQNGARLYLDVGSHPEYATPECDSIYECVVHDKAGERILEQLVESAEERLAEESIRGTIYLFKNNTDSAGNSYGCHENFLLSRDLPFGRMASQITPHFVTRQIFCGAGKVGCELPGRPNDDIGYQISQRADFFEEEIGLETTLKRPIVNTRDEPHADAQKYRRLHVIVGDANMSEVATYLKVGTSSIILSMIEDDELGNDWLLGNPVAAIRQISHDPSLRQTIMLRDGSRATALEIQWGLFERAQKYAETHGLESVGEAVGADVMVKWETVLQGLETDPDSMGHWVDWIAKKRLVEGYADRHGLAPGATRLKAIDLQYHDMRRDKCLADRAGLDTLVTVDEAVAAMTAPPSTTRAYFRGACLDKFPDEIVAANWDSLVFDVGRNPLRRVPMMEPLKGTADHVAALIDGCDTARELLDRLGQ